MGHVAPNSLRWAVSFSRPAMLVPAPQVEQTPRTCSRHTVQSIPQAPVVIKALPSSVRLDPASRNYSPLAVFWIRW